MRRLLFISLAGAMFGFGLAVSGMTNPARVLGFLDVAGQWDPTLLFVMAGATGVVALGYLMIRAANPGQVTLPPASSGPISMSLLAGAAIFGIGWGIVGLCPGPSLANLAGLRVEAIAFVLAMALGMILAQRFFGADRS